MTSRAPSLAVSAKRPGHPSGALLPPPIYVSQLTSLELVGIDSRRFLELLVAHREVPRATVGKLRVVAVDDLRALLSRLALRAPAETAEPLEGDDDQPSSPEAVLAALGLKRSA